VNELVKLGAITPEQALYHPQRNAVTQAIGALDELVPILYKTDLMQDDIILLCSDGLTNMLSDVELQVAIESYKNMEALVDGLIGMANNHGGYDNITVIAAKIY
jgi:protein phosphatase